MTTPKTRWARAKSRIRGGIIFFRPKNYPTSTALVPVRKTLDEAGTAVADAGRTIKSFTVPPSVGAVAGVGVGAVSGWGILTFGAKAGTVGAAAITSGLAAAGHVIGGGMMLGIGVVAAPAVILGVSGYAYLAKKKRDKLRVEKEALLQEALRKHDGILRALQEEAAATRDRLELLRAMNFRLTDVIRNLRQDLGQGTT